MFTDAERAAPGATSSFPRGEPGQARLKAGSCSWLGACGLGSPALLYLAAAGIGRMASLNRHVDSRIAAAGALWHARLGVRNRSGAGALDVNPLVELERIRRGRAPRHRLVSRYDLVIDGPTISRALSRPVRASSPNGRMYGSCFGRRSGLVFASKDGAVLSLFCSAAPRQGESRLLRGGGWVCFQGCGTLQASEAKLMREWVSADLGDCADEALGPRCREIRLPPDPGPSACVRPSRRCRSRVCGDLRRRGVRNHRGGSAENIDAVIRCFPRRFENRMNMARSIMAAA